MLALLAPFLGSALGLGTVGTAGIGALLGATSAGLAGAKGNDLVNAALLGGIGGGLGGSMLSQAGQVAGQTAAAGANALPGVGAVPELASAATEGATALTGAGAVPMLPPTPDATAFMPPTSGWDRMTQQVEGLSNPDFWKNVGTMRPAGMMYAAGGINDIGVAAQERKRQKKLQEAFKPRWAVDNPYGTARRLSEGGEVEVSRGVRKAQIDRAVAEAEGRPTRGPKKDSMGPARPQGVPDAPGADFFKPRGKPAESQEDAVRRIRGTPQRYAAGGIAQIPNTTMTGQYFAQGGRIGMDQPVSYSALKATGTIGRMRSDEIPWYETLHPNPAKMANALGNHGLMPVAGPEGLLAQRYYDKRAIEEDSPNVFAQGGYLSGKSDGQADQVAAVIDGAQPAQLSHGEFVVPADVVAMLGNGNSEAGSETLQQMLDRVRQASTGRKKQINQINPKKVLPA